MTAIATVISAYKSFGRILDRRHRRRTGIIYLWSIGIAMADIAGLGGMIPVLMLAIDHSFLEKSRKLRWLYHQFGFESEPTFLIALIAFILAFFLLKSLLAVLLHRFVRKTCMHIATDLSSKSYDHAFRYYSYEKVSRDGLGFTDHVLFTPYYFVSGIYLPFINLITETVVVFMLIAVFTIYQPVLFLLTAGLLGITFYIVNTYTRKRVTELGEARGKARDAALSELNFGISGFTDVKAHGAEAFFRKRYMSHFNRFVVSGIKAVNFQLLPARINEVAALIGIVVLVVYGYFYSGDNLGQVRVLAALYAISVFRMIPAANRLLQALMHLKMHGYTIGKLESVASHANDSPLGKTPQFQTKIEIENLGFTYEDNAEPIFKNANLTVNKGEVIGIGGPSGSGKTTLAKILLGFHKPAEGRILIDGIEPGDTANLSGLYSYMGQEPYVLTGTVCENVALGIDKEKIDNEKVLESLKQAAFSLIGEKDPIHYFVGEHGARLSEGQKQRLVLARELYRRAPVLILDEPTSALDEERENGVIETLKSLKKAGQTMIIIAHRTRILELCDTVYHKSGSNFTRGK